MNEVENQQLLELARSVHCRDNTHSLMNCAMIDCNVSITDYGRLVRSRKFPCFSYSETSPNGIFGLISKKQGECMLHFTAHKSYIMVYPVRNENYNPQDLVDYFYYIRQTIDTSAQLMSYQDYQNKHNM